MTDIYDQASDKEMRDRELSIAHARSKNHPLKTTGFCLNCNERLEIGRFCFGGECKEDYEKEQKIKGIMGR